MFGSVVIEGEALASYCGWEAALNDEQRVRWTAALDQVAATKDPASAFAMIEELVEFHPLPRELATWFANAVNKPLPARYTEHDGAQQNNPIGAPTAKEATAPTATAPIPEA